MKTRFAFVLPNARTLRLLVNGNWECQPADDNIWVTAVSAQGCLKTAGWDLRFEDLKLDPEASMDPAIQFTQTTLRAAEKRVELYKKHECLCPDCRDKVPKGTCPRCAQQAAETRATKAEAFKTKVEPVMQRIYDVLYWDDDKKCFSPVKEWDSANDFLEMVDNHITALYGEPVEGSTAYPELQA